MLRLLPLIVLLTMASACATPVGVTREDPKVLYRAFSKSVLSALLSGETVGATVGN